MPYAPKFKESFRDKLVCLKDETKAVVITELKGVLEEVRNRGPRGVGGRKGSLWGYPFSALGKSAFICDLKDEKQQIVFLDIILNF